MNKVILIGNVGQDPEVKQFDNGNKIANLSLATSETYKDKQGQKQTITEWHRLVFNFNVEVVEKYIKKGMKLAIEGKLNNKEYTDKDGLKKFITQIKVDKFHFVGSAPQSNGNTQQNQDTTPDDLPF